MHARVCMLAVACRRTIDRRVDEEMPAHWQAQDVILGRQCKAEQARVMGEDDLRGQAGWGRREGGGEQSAPGTGRGIYLRAHGLAYSAACRTRHRFRA